MDEDCCVVVGLQLCCEECSKICKTKQAFDIHKRSHTNERPYSCDKCDKKYKDASVLNHHKKINHNKSSRYQCDSCDRIFLTHRRLEKHVLTHDPMKIVC